MLSGFFESRQEESSYCFRVFSATAHMHLKTKLWKICMQFLCQSFKVTFAVTQEGSIIYVQQVFNCKHGALSCTLAFNSAILFMSIFFREAVESWFIFELKRRCTCFCCYHLNNEKKGWVKHYLLENAIGVVMKCFSFPSVNWSWTSLYTFFMMPRSFCSIPYFSSILNITFWSMPLKAYIRSMKRMQDSLPWYLLVMSRFLRQWRASWQPICPNCVWAPMVLRRSRSFFATMVLIFFVVVSFRQIGLQFFGSHESSFPLHRRDKMLVCHNSKSQLLSCQQFLMCKIEAFWREVSWLKTSW